MRIIYKWNWPIISNKGIGRKRDDYLKHLFSTRVEDWPSAKRQFIDQFSKMSRPLSFFSRRGMERYQREILESFGNVFPPDFEDIILS